MLKMLMVALLSMPLMVSAGDKHECHFAPENNLNIPADALVANGMTEEIFDSVLARVEKHYRPIVEGKGARFELQKDWNDGTVNAYAQQQGNLWLIKMFGGLARHEHVIPDGFTLVACHEMGHHLAGAPKSQAWASNEGQSDYFATTKCARRVWAEDNNVAIMEQRLANGEVPETAQRECAAAWNTQEERALCMRTTMGGISLGKTLAALGGQGTPSLDTPDTSKVSRTNNQHPKGQCRTDTYFQGTLCTVAFDVDFDNRDHSVGACTRAKGAEKGVRPLCWYKPTAGGGGGGPTPSPIPSPGPGPNPTPTPGGSCPLEDQSLCDQLCQMDPSLPWCNQIKFW